MNISFASSTFQSVQAMPQTQAASTVALKSKTASSAGNAKDTYTPFKSDSSGTYKSPSSTNSTKLSPSDWEFILRGKPPNISVEDFRNFRENTITGRVITARQFAFANLFESLEINETVSWQYHPDRDIVTGSVGAFVAPGGGSPGTPLPAEWAEAFRDVYKTTIVEGKSLAEWESVPKITSQGMFLYYEGDPANPNPIYETESSGVKLPSFLTNSFKTQKASSPMSGVTKNLNRMVLEGVITRTLEANGVELKKGDILSMNLNGEGTLTINTNLSRIDGAIGDALDELSDKLSEKLNEAETEEGELLGDALLAMFAADMGFDPEAVKGDPNFSILFSFQYNSQTGRNEIAGARITQMGSQMLKTIATEEPAEPETAKSMNVTFGNAKQ